MRKYVWYVKGEQILQDLKKATGSGRKQRARTKTIGEGGGGWPRSGIPAYDLMP